MKTKDNYPAQIADQLQKLADDLAAVGLTESQWNECHAVATKIAIAMSPLARQRDGAWQRIEIESPARDIAATVGGIKGKLKAEARLVAAEPNEAEQTLYDGLHHAWKRLDQISKGERGAKPQADLLDGLKVIADRLATANDREPIGKNARLLYEKLLSLPQHQAMITSEILDWFMSQKIIISEDVLRKEILPQLNLYGIKNKPRIGYFIPASARPQSGDTPR